MRRINPRGDTIIEVVLSMALLTSVLFIAWGITNRATIIQRAARERVQMVNEVKEQAELIKAKWASNGDFFNDPNSYPSVSIPNADPCDPGPSGGGLWYLEPNASNTDIVPVSGDKKQVDDNPDKQVWVQRVSNLNNQGEGYNEFYIRACWVNNSGTTNKTESSQVILRLNT